MDTTVEVNVLRAFVDEEGKYGNPTGIILDEEHKLTTVVRQRIATRLHFTDTVFINDLDNVNVSFFNPEQETKFAGDSLISTSYLIRHVLGRESDLITCKGGQVKTWDAEGLTWIEASLEGTAPWIHRQLDSVQEVDDITVEEAEKFEHTMVWAWADEERELIRSRTFLPDWGTLEDQGNGSGSMQLAKMLGRKIEIRQGRGSVIYADCTMGNKARVGGRVVVDNKKTILT